MQPREFFSRFLANFEDLKAARPHFFKELSEMSEEIKLIAPHFDIPAPGTYELAALERDPWNAKLSVMIAYSMALNQRLVLYPIDPNGFKKSMRRKDSLTAARKARKIDLLNPNAHKRFLAGELVIKSFTIWYEDNAGQAHPCSIPNMFTHLFDLEISSIARGVCKIKEEVENALPKYKKQPQ